MSDEEEKIEVLYVEDDTQARELLEKLLRLKYPALTLHTAANGEEGLELFNRHHPGLVITDINMPLVNGIEMGRQMKDRDPDLLIIAISAYHDGNYAEAAREAFETYIVKPLEYTKLLEAINDGVQIVRERRKRRREQ